MTRYLGVDVSHHEELDVFEHLLRDFQLLLVVRQHSPGRQQRALPRYPLFPRARCKTRRGPGLSRPPPPAEPPNRASKARAAGHTIPRQDVGGVEGRGESHPHKAAPPARSTTTAAAGLCPLLIHRRYPRSSLFPRTGPADSIRVRSSPRAGCNGLAPNDRGGQRGYPAPPIDGGGKATAFGHAPRVAQVTPPQAPPLGPAVRGRGRWRRGRSAGSGSRCLCCVFQ